MAAISQSGLGYLPRIRQGSTFEGTRKQIRTYKDQAKREFCWSGHSKRIQKGPFLTNPEATAPVPIVIMVFSCWIYAVVVAAIAAVAVAVPVAGAFSWQSSNSLLDSFKKMNPDLHSPAQQTWFEAFLFS